MRSIESEPRVHITSFKFWGFSHIFGMDEARQFKFCTRIDADEY